MSMDRSLKGANTLIRHRNVLTRAERLVQLTEEEKWTDAKSVFGLPKVAHRKMALAKTVKEEEAADADRLPRAAAPRRRYSRMRSRAGQGRCTGRQRRRARRRCCAEAPQAGQGRRAGRKEEVDVTPLLINPEQFENPFWAFAIYNCVPCSPPPITFPAAPSASMPPASARSSTSRQR